MCHTSHACKTLTQHSIALRLTHELAQRHTHALRAMMVRRDARAGPGHLHGAQRRRTCLYAGARMVALQRPDASPLCVAANGRPRFDLQTEAMLGRARVRQKAGLVTGGCHLRHPARRWLSVERNNEWSPTKTEQVEEAVSRVAERADEHVPRAPTLGRTSVRDMLCDGAVCVCAGRWSSPAARQTLSVRTPVGSRVASCRRPPATRRA